MKYAIWRHENALGNSAEHAYGLAKHLVRNNEVETCEIYCETEFQRAFALCIPDIRKEQVHLFEEGTFANFNLNRIGEIFTEKLNNSPKYHDIRMPDCYGHSNLPVYNATWQYLADEPDVTLRYPDHYHNSNYAMEWAKDCILMQIREPNTYWKRVDGANCEPERFVNKQTFFDIALHYANKGHKVVRIGDSKQTPMPEHENIIDFTKALDRTIMDDLYILSQCKVFLSCDSGIWPIAGGMKKNLVLSNVMSAVNKKEIVTWLPKETSIVHFKEHDGRGRVDNSFEQLTESINHFL